MEEISRLSSIEQIRSTKARYFRALDERDWELFAGTLATDVVFEHPTIGRHRGRDATTTAVRDRIEALSFTAHHGSNAEVQVHSPDRASGIWSLHSAIRVADGPLRDGYGRYFDTFRPEDGSWRIATLRLVHLYK